MLKILGDLGLCNFNIKQYKQQSLKIDIFKLSKGSYLGVSNNICFA